MGPDEVIRALALAPHPEGGHFAQTWCDAPATGERSAWHRIDAAEVWHLYAGGPVLMRISRDGSTVMEHRLGTDLTAGERPQVVVPARAWQAAEPLGPWALVGCTVAPAFVFSGWELAPPGWEPR